MTEDFSDFEKTQPSPHCEGDVSCAAPVAVIFLMTGSRMCVEHALDELNYQMLKGMGKSDTEQAPPGGSPTLPPISDIEIESWDEE